MALQWLPCQAPGVIGSVLGLVGPVSVYCDWVRKKVWSTTSISVWQHVKLSEQIRPWDTLACCWDVKQPTNNQQTNVVIIIIIIIIIIILITNRTKTSYIPELLYAELELSNAGLGEEHLPQNGHVVQLQLRRPVVAALDWDDALAAGVAVGVGARQDDEIGEDDEVVGEDHGGTTVVEGGLASQRMATRVHGAAGIGQAGVLAIKEKRSARARAHTHN